MIINHLSINQIEESKNRPGENIGQKAAEGGKTSTKIIVMHTGKTVNTQNHQQKKQPGAQFDAQIRKIL